MLPFFSKTKLAVARTSVGVARRHLGSVAFGRTPVRWSTEDATAPPPPVETPSPPAEIPKMPTVRFGGDNSSGEHFSIVKHNLDSLNGVKDEADDIFAVFKVSGTQMKATIDDVIITNKLKNESGDLKVGTTIEFEDVLLVGTKTRTIVGRPVVPRAKVVATVEEQTRDKKIIVFKKKKRKGYKKKYGHRSYITSMRILDIVVDESMRA